MSSMKTHRPSGSTSQNHKAQLANAYNELGKELSSSRIRVVGNYTLGRVIGEGAYGKVRMGTHRLTQARVAIKQIPKAVSATLTREIHHHRQLHHPHITQMFEVIATESHIWIVTELCCGGELFDYLAEKGRLEEDEARIIFGQLCLAVAYLHEKGIVHRDLKLENVLLDERCRVKLGDFGFTREFERGSLMETFCGTTGYASPEMLQGRKYQGPEVDVWSLGIILYTLLTGTLPFDDDDEGVMRDMIIRGEFEDPAWLSLEARDLLKNVLQQDPARRLTIPQILSHAWFTAKDLTYQPDLPDRPPTPEQRAEEAASLTDSNPPSDASVSSFQSASSEINTPAPTTPDDSTTSDDPFRVEHPNGSQTTIKDANSGPKLPFRASGVRHPETVFEEEGDDLDQHPANPPPLDFPQRSNSTSSRPAHTARTPARTKRRSVSSTLSDPGNVTGESFVDDSMASTLPTPLTLDKPVDFTNLLTTPAPIIFSTQLERDLLNSLSMLGFDTGQMVHSVLSDACDAAGAVWWMLKRKAEKKAIEETRQEEAAKDEEKAAEDKAVSEAVDARPRSHHRRHKHRNAGTQTEPALTPLRMMPQLAFVPPTPTFARPSTPPVSGTPTQSPFLSPSTTTVDASIASTTEASVRSNPNTPSNSVKDKDTRTRKTRSGSVSIMQRATTALEAAGLVRKKSNEAVREAREQAAKEHSERKVPERKGSTGPERKGSTGSIAEDAARSSHGSGGSSRLTKSPPPRLAPPSTPPPSEHTPSQTIGSPWVLTNKDSAQQINDYIPPPTPSNTPGEGMRSSPVFGPENPRRNRANILSAFRLWFNEERKGKRKDDSRVYARPAPSPGMGYSSATAKRRGSSSKTGTRRGTHRAQRPFVSSRRSSSVNSRRSSVASVQMIMLDSPQPVNPSTSGGRRSFGAHTPNSEAGDYPSRPSSVRSFGVQHHRKSHSAGSTGSHYRTASPMKYHHRAGSNSSTTRVVRQPRPPHARSNSATSSIHSPPSSRPASYYEPSESEDYGRTASPYKHKRRSEERRSGSTFVASKRSPFAVYGGGTLGRSSWKKSWGLEPPGWQSRSAHLPIEVLAISPAEGTSIRDVFSGGRQSLNMGDESDWVDEDDDVPAFAGGLGQMGTSSSGGFVGGTAFNAAASGFGSSPSPFGGSSLEGVSAPPRGHRATTAAASKRVRSSSGGRSKSSQSPSERVSPLPSESTFETTERAGRRQLPGRSGAAFKQAIQEEDEEEEE
ncbi:Pkinase-domain-containing protein [Schizophyllum fasciatum]